LAGVYEELQDKYGQGKYGISYIYVYVSTSGNDANDGLSPSTPVRTLVRAIEVANTINSVSNVLIKVGSGLYTPGSGLSNANVGLVINRPNLIISGGWNSDFTSVIDKSEFDGNNSLFLHHIVMITNVTNVRLESLVIRGGNANVAPNDSGGGIYVSNVSYLVIESNVVISNNSANQCGGGLYLINSSNNTISGSVYSNSAYYGGGMYLVDSSNNTISGSVYGNSANYYGGGVYLDNSDYFTNTGWITNNTVINTNYGSGGGVYTNGSHANSYFGNVSNNIPDDIAPH
jgi:parallel beta-helix repeat protein